MTDDRHIALAGLLRCCEPPAPPAVAAYVADRGPVEAWAHLADRSAPASVLRHVAARLGTHDEAGLRARARNDLHAAAAAGSDIIGPGDADWPESSFAALDGVPPYHGCPGAAPPLALYRRGNAGLPPTGRAIAIVGSRAATPYGMRVAGDLAGGAVGEGLTVISGAAFGIDIAAHRAALGAGSPSAPPTVAVLACGIDRSYPSAHRAALDAIAASGAVVTEYPPGAVPARHRFLVRNRLLAALAAATVVVEAGRRSGSLNTANTAANLARTVAAVPGPVTSAMSVGCHDLIRDHRAEIVTGWPDVAALVGPVAADPPVHRRGQRATDGLDLVASRVHEALAVRRALRVEQIAAEAGMDVPDVLASLTMLELDGLAQRSADGWRKPAAPRH